MLIQDFIQIPVGFEAVRDLVLRDPHAVLDDSIAAAYHDGEQLCLRLSPGPEPQHAAEKVWVDIGDSYARGDGIIIPVHWSASGSTHLFPRLDGDLEVMPIGDETTQITLMGRYDAPVGAPGRRLDRMLLHRLAEASVRSFLNRLGALLQQIGGPPVRHAKPEPHGVRSTSPGFHAVPPAAG